jgi:hypothetical protein
MGEMEFLRNFSQDGPRLMWFLGAGASRSSGLPTATDIIWDLKCRIYCAQQNEDIQSHDVGNKAIRARIQGYMDSQGYPPLWDPHEYSFYFNQMFGTDYGAQQRYLKEVLSTGKIASSIGHRVLASLLKMGKTRLIFTTNFDEVVETAYSAVAGASLPVFHLEGSYAAINALNADQFPLYVKLHGDFRYQSVKNLANDLLRNDKELQRCFVAAAARFGLIVSGYSGRDENVISMFKEAIDQNNAFPQGFYWSTPRITDVATGVINLIDYAQAKGVNAKLVQTGTFDEMLSKIWRNTSGKSADLNAKVRSATAKPAAITLPPSGNRYPILRTNALRISRLPEACAAITYEGEIDIGDMRSKLFEVQPDCTLAYTDRILFWGDRANTEKVLDPARVRAVNTFKLDDLAKFIDESGIIKSFVEEAIAKALIVDKPLLLRRAKRTWYAVVKHDETNSEIFNVLRRTLGFNGGLGNISANIRGLADVYWAEAVSIRVEERNGVLWLLLRPDIWISPLKARQEAAEFLRQRKLKRYNNQSYDLLSAWIGILVGSVGGPRSAELIAHPGSQYPASFEINTRSAYSRRGTANG